MDYEAMMQKAIESINRNVVVGTKFVVRDLFEGHEWERLGKGDLINFGKYFSNQIKDNKISNVIKLERNKSNHSTYQKISK